jgi:predicted O-linked N-acetylglucosamine transferase (SPINDLY family)
MSQRKAIEDAFATAVREYDAGRIDRSEALCNKILELSPDHADAVHLHSKIAFAAGFYSDALELAQQAIELDSNHSGYHLTKARALVRLERNDDAIAACDEAMRLASNDAQIFYEAGVILMNCDARDRGMRAFDRALELRPTFPEIFALHGHALRQDRRFDEAIEAFSRAVELDPNLTEARNNLGCVLQDVGRVDEAIACFEEGIRRDPQCAALHSNLLYAMHFQERSTPQTLRDAHAKWNCEHIEPRVKRFADYANDRSPERRFRIGYISPDFRWHCQCLFTTPLLREHDRERFEIFCYSDVRTDDAITAHLRGFVDVWRDILGQSDDAVAEQIRSDRIDVLVDLTQHMARNRLMMLARKPAPVQVSWLAYPGETGLAAIDARFSDPFLDDPREGVHLLPKTYWCYDPHDEPAVNDLPAIRNGHVTFGCFNNFCKASPTTLALWGRVLRQMPNARLMFLAPRGSARRFALQHLGIDESRVEFVDFVPREQYLRRYYEVDLCLDTFPYNGHTTTLDGLWMGVPVVSLCGKTPVSRAGFSLFSNLGLADEFVAHDEEGFVRLAIARASEIDRLRELRRQFRDRLFASPMMDHEQFARDIENAYRSVWTNWCNTASLAPL